MSYRYKAWNGPMPTTAAQASSATVSGIKTMLQLAPPTGRYMKLLSWGFSVGGSAALTSTSTVELIQTDVAATVIAHVAAGVQPQDPNGPASALTLGTSATGYAASAEGSTTTTRTLDAQVLEALAGENNFVYAYQWLPDEAPIVKPAAFLRVRATFGDTAHTMLTWVCWDE
jgi:hypothetical protein